MISSIVVLSATLGIMYLMAYWFDKPWKCPLLSVERRKELAQDRIDIIEGTRVNWPEWVQMRGEKVLARENIELEHLRHFVSDERN